MAYRNPVTINLWETAFPTYTKNGGFEKMKLKKVLCMAVLSAAVALTGVPQGMATSVHAEETQIAGLDEVLRQMYALYQSGDYNAMYTLDINAGSYAEAVRSSGADRYVVDLDGNTKVMMFVSNDGGYWWYFGQMENNLRQGNGTTFAFESEEQYTVFTGTYAADYPSGAGTYSHHCYSGENNGARYDISGNFQGTLLNGVYQVDMQWINDDGIVCKSSLPHPYANNHLRGLEDSLSLPYYFSDVFYETVDFGKDEIFIFGYANGDVEQARCWSYPTEYLNNGLPVFYGNANTSAIPSSSTATTQPVAQQTTQEITSVPTTPETPAPTVTNNSYTVQRGDNLSKIAQKVYGDKKYWKNIYEANKATIKKDYTIWANQVLTIPSL